MFSFVLNAVVVLLGTFIGLVFKKYIKKEICDAVLKAIGLTVFVVGIIGTVEYMVTANYDGSLTSSGTLAIIISIAVGTFIGEFLKIDDVINNFALKVEKKINRGKIAEGFVTATLIYCVGSMAIIGSFESALGNPNTIYLKSALDGISSIVLASTLGFGVGLSSISILIYQGLLTLLFFLLGDFMPDGFITLFNSVGYIMVAAIGLNFLLEKKIKVANMLPSLVVCIICYLVMQWF